MPVIRKAFGHLTDGRSVDSILLLDPTTHFSVEILEYGATLRAINVPDSSGRLINTILSYPRLADYEAGNAYLGATVGRCAGRTAAEAHPTLRLTSNEGSIHLHGGRTGFSHSLWKVIDLDDRHSPTVFLRHHSPSGEDGYPGNVQVDVEFSVLDGFVLRVIMRARTNVDTPLNLTQHPYFNLSGDPASRIDDHCLRINSDLILPLGPERLATRDIMPIQNTPFDFRVPRAIGATGYDGHPQLRMTGGYDHYYVLNDRARVAADVYSPRSSLGMRIRTNQRGLQFYSGNQLDQAEPVAFPVKSAFCLEPHGYPNAINEPRFPDITLRSGHEYVHETSYELYRSKPTICRESTDA